VVVCVTPPPLAVIVTWEVPVVAALLAVKVRVELPLPGAPIKVGLKLAVTPAGRTEADREIAELNPPVTVVEIVLLPEPPCVTDKLVGAALRVKLGFAAAFTVRVTVVVCVTPPPLAEIVTWEVPVAAALLAEKVRVELPLPGAPIEVGLKLAVTPAGRPEADREIAELNPPVTVVEIVPLPELPWDTDRLVGEALKLKLGAALPGLKTMSVTECNSIWLGAAPVCPWGKSCMPTPVIRTGTLSVWKLVVTLNMASTVARALVTPGDMGLLPGTQVGAGTSAIMVLPEASWITK
jgi:hypothetical protein